MARKPKQNLPPIAVEDHSEKLSISFPAELRSELERFGEFFVAETGQKPLSFNALVVGVIAGYLEDHIGFRRWQRAHRSEPSQVGESA